MTIHQSSVTSLPTHILRRVLRSEIHELIELLDAIEGDADFEPDDDNEDCGDAEAWLGWPGWIDQSRRDYGDGDHTQGYDREADSSDFEPTLGAPERHPHSQETLYCGVREPSTRYEPRREYIAGKSQEFWADGLRGDHEREDENEHGGNITDGPHDDVDGELERAY